MSKGITFARPSRLLKYNPFKFVSIAEAAKFKASSMDRHGDAYQHPHQSSIVPKTDGYWRLVRIGDW